MKRLIIDTSSVCWTCLLAGKDKEHGREVEVEVEKDGVRVLKPVWVNSALFGYENAMNHIISAMDKFGIVPSNMIFVTETGNTKAVRKAVLPQYKDGRDDRPPEAYAEFEKLHEMLADQFLNLGAQFVTQQDTEADDIIAYLCQHLDGEKIIQTNDGDLAVLVGDGTHIHKGGEVDVNPYGPFPFEFITVYKALVGDTSDKIPGAFKFGDKAFLDMYVKWGDEGLAAMRDLIKDRQLDRLSEDVGDLKALQKVIDNAQMVYKCYEVASLMPHLVNTLRRPLQWRAGMVKAGAGASIDSRLRVYAQQIRLITADNYDQAKAWARAQIESSPFVTLDIETSTPPESDDWIESRKRSAGDDDDKVVVDVLGSRLTGMGLTFGNNSQYTFYLSVDHKDTKNLTVAQVRDFVDMIPRETRTIVHNFAFEGPVLYQEWGQDWADDPVYHGQLRNVRDTRIMGTYVDENRRQGLKDLSSTVLGYTQQTYKEVTTIGDRQFKMNELTAKHVLSYGADDPICTAALWNHFRIICEIENTFHVFEDVETFPAYLTNLAFVQGADMSMQTMLDMEKEDDEAYNKAWSILRSALIEKGWEGTVCPTYTELTPATIKEALFVCCGEELKTQVRTVSKFPPLIREWAAETGDNQKAYLIASLVEAEDLVGLNRLVASCFTGEPVLDVNSPKKMRAFLYDLVGMPLRIINDITPTERKEKPALADAARRFKKLKAGGQATLTAEDLELLKSKAKTDDTAVDFALAFDTEAMIPEAVEMLRAFQTMKKVDTRRKLYYRPYRSVRHWKDNRIHSEMKQCQAVTRRYASSNPNLQQLPKKGEGVKFRQIILPHHKDAVVCSIDFSGQELRLAAWRSQDPNMLSCYIGNNLRDLHSLTASFAMKLKWGSDMVQFFAEKYGVSDDYDLFLKIRKSSDEGDHKKADDLRKDSKNVNFAAQFGGQAPKLSETLIMPLEDAQLFLDARSKMFPKVEERAEAAASEAKSTGYAMTMLGARRHLASAMVSEDRWEVERAARQAWNMEIQGSAAEMAKLAMKRLWLSDFLWKYDARFIAPIHDELVTSIAIKDAPEAIKIKHECMVQKYADMEIPVLGSISLGRNFGEQIECGDWYIEENIQKALASCGRATA